jgi:ADP-dependent NAD(P)H-hydrate dehydratase / NAD(P)H-hydrate epimerase
MLPVLNAAQMRAADRHTIDVLGLPDEELMERAGAAVARVLDEEFGDARPAVLCGRGNNGGDGFAVARRMLSLRPLVLLFGRRADVTGGAGRHLARLEAAGGTVRELVDEAAWSVLRPEVLACGVIVDALLGTGLRAAPTGVIGRAIRDLRECDNRPPIVAVDIPSGLSSDTGAIQWPALDALVTVAIAAPKYGHVLPPSSDRVGRLLVADIGIPREVCAADAQLFLLEAQDVALVYPERTHGGHKGDYGHVLVLGGSVGKTGAVALTAHAALRAGAGLVTVVTPEAALPLLVAQARPEVMTEPLPSGWTTAGLERALELAAACDAVVLGPGLGRGSGAVDFVHGLMRSCECPLLVDADALNALAQGRGMPERSLPTVLTPHPGEMARLMGTETSQIQARRLESARELAQRNRVHVVLKGQRTLIAAPGGRAAVNPTGNPGMATAGTGDVLSGVIGALLARGTGAWEAATAGVYLHGLAGDLGARRLGQESLLAGDVIAALPEALRAIRQAE